MQSEGVSARDAAFAWSPRRIQLPLIAILAYLKWRSITKNEHSCTALNSAAYRADRATPSAQTCGRTCNCTVRFVQTRLGEHKRYGLGFGHGAYSFSHSFAIFTVCSWTRFRRSAAQLGQKSAPAMPMARPNGPSVMICMKKNFNVQQTW